MGFGTQMQAQSYIENFVEIQDLAYKDWHMKNQSSALGQNDWSQGDVKVFSAYEGGAKDYIAANYNNASGFGNDNNISNWLITPNRIFRNGDTFSFYTRKRLNTIPDRLEVRFSNNGASTDTGNSATDVGDFSKILLTINPALTKTDYPTDWKKYTVTISDLDQPTSGRIAFRYYVTNAGLEGMNSDFIGIDTVEYTESKTLQTTNASVAHEIKIYPNPVKDILFINSKKEIHKVVILSIDGKKVFEKKSKNLNSVDVRQLNKGVYIINIYTENKHEILRFIKD